MLHLIHILISAIVLVTFYSEADREHQVDICSLYQNSERILYLDATIITF